MPVKTMRRACALAASVADGRREGGHFPQRPCKELSTSHNYSVEHLESSFGLARRQDVLVPLVRHTESPRLTSASCAVSAVDDSADSPMLLVRVHNRRVAWQSKHTNKRTKKQKDKGTDKQWKKQTKWHRNQPTNTDTNRDTKKTNENQQIHEQMETQTTNVLPKKPISAVMQICVPFPLLPLYRIQTWWSSLEANCSIET